MERTDQSSKQTWLWVLLAAFVIVSIGLAVVIITLLKSGGRSSRTEGGSITPIDLTAFYDRSGSWDTGSEWQQAPRGPTVLGGVPFEMNGLLRLSGRSARNDSKPYRDEVKGIPVGRKLERLHVLHIVSYSTSREEPYARITLRHADGSTTPFALIYGQHGRDWHRPKYEYPSTLGDPNSKVVWRGEYDETATRGKTLRIFKTTFTNPKPEVEVTAVDLSSEQASPNATIIAMSIGPADLPKPEEDPPSLPEPEAPYDGEVKFTAMDAQSGKPVAGVHLKISGSEAGGSFRAPDAVTDAKGECIVKHPGDSTRTVTVLASADGIAAKTIRWLQRDEEVIPTSYTFRVEKGVSIGGVVQDETGQALRGVTLTLSALPTPGTSYSEVPFSQIVLTNDDKGRWEFRSLPENFESLQIVTAHPEHVEGRYICDAAGSAYGGERVKLEALRKAEAVFKLRKGLVVTGRVLKENGEPISGARLLLGDSRFVSKPTQGRTDEQGEFRIPGANPGPTHLTVQASGFAPESRPITVDAKIARVEFRLAPGHVFKAKVVDEAGRPVRTARISVDMWQNRQTLELSASTDSQGQATIHSAPASGMSGSISKSGYMYLNSQQFVADGQEHTFTMRRSVTITGTVMDADSKQPIERFDVTRGQSMGGERIHWHTYDVTKGANGSFSIRLSQENITALQVESDDHLPAVITLGTNETHFEVELKKGSGPKGIVLAPDGAPAAGAQLGVLIRGTSIGVSAGRIDSYGEGSRAVTASTNGAFTLRSYAKAEKIIATHPSGYLETSYSNFVSGGTLTLQRWGTIEGTLKIGQRPGANESITLSSDSSIHFNMAQIKTDDQGRFFMGKVPPGERRLARLIPLGNNSWGHSHLEAVTVKTGEVTTVSMGGNGRAVTGKLAVSDPSLKIDWRQSGHHSLSSYPRSRPFRTTEEYQAWENLPATMAARRQARSYTLLVQEDGNFRIDDVVAGDYDLRVHLTQGDDGRGMGKHIGTLTTNIIVPEISAPASAPPLDLGMFVIPINAEAQRRAAR